MTEPDIPMLVLQIPLEVPPMLLARADEVIVRRQQLRAAVRLAASVLAFCLRSLRVIYGN
jgi:hypothetical protein